MNTLRWGILSTAKIAREKLIPAIQNSKMGEVLAIASRNLDKANQTAALLQIPRAYGSYEALLLDAEIDAIYIPLPNHLHVEWSKKALLHGKHVLCEKPIALSSDEAIDLQKASLVNPSVKLMEAFMYKFHPQWALVKSLVAAGKIGTLKHVQSFFSYYNADMNNIRNRSEMGGGGLMDIGCYCISFARYLFESEPQKIIGHMDFDPQAGTDRYTSAIMEFEGGISSFTCSTQLMPYQRVNILGTEGRIEVEIPVNALPSAPANLSLFTKDGMESFKTEVIDQYSAQCDAFATAIFNQEPVPIPFSDSIQNMKVLESIVRSAREATWVYLQ